MSIEQTEAFAVPFREIALDVFRAWLREWVAIARQWTARVQAAQQIRLARVVFGGSEVLVYKPDVPGPSRIGASEEFHSPSPILSLRRDLPRGGPIVLCFRAEEILRVVVRLPKAKAPVLRKALAFELARLSPVPPEQLYFDFRTGQTAKGEAEVELGVRAIRRATVDEAISICRAAGLATAAIQLGDDSRPAQWRSFPVDGRALLISWVSRFKSLALAGLAGLLCLLLLMAVYGRGEATLDAISGELATTQIAASKVERTQMHVAALGRAQLFLAQRKQRPLLIGALAELSSRLPEDTWITDLGKSGGTIRMQGYSKSASRLVGEIVSSRHFRNAQFQAPLTRDPATGSEHFDLSFDVSP